MQRLTCLLVPAALLIAGLPGCAKGCGKGGAGAERLSVSVSIFPIYDLVRRIAGPDADVMLVVPPGHDEHAFQPSPSDVAKAAKAKVGVMVGLGLDPWLEKMVKGASPSARIVKVGDRVPTLTVKEDAAGDAGAKTADDDRDEETIDPHAWLDPERARLMVRAVAEELGKADSAHAIDYRRRATEIDQSLSMLDKEVEARTKALPKRGFVTFHGSFQYFAERYKLDVVAVVEPRPGTPPTPEHVAAVLETIKAKKVPVVFSEPQLDARPAARLASEAKIRLGTLDALGGGPETDSYEKTIRYDVTQLEKYLE